LQDAEKTYSSLMKLRRLFGVKLRCVIDAKLNSNEWFAEYRYILTV